jgi:hypothetical protein
LELVIKVLELAINVFPTRSRFTGKSRIASIPTGYAPAASQRPRFKRRRNAAFCGMDTPLGGWASRTPLLVSAGRAQFFKMEKYSKY